MSSDQQNVLIPLKVDAFVFNDAVCKGGPGKAKIAPISQPNYSFLRLEDSYLQSDILYDVDLHNAAPADNNSRITDLGTRERRENRRGVYVHWTIPRIYRSGTALTSDGDKDSQGLPEFPEPPSRWLVVRHIHNLNQVQPKEAAEKLQRVTGWIVESDRCRMLDGKRVNGDIQDEDKINILPTGLDLQVDVSPFVSPSDNNVDGSVLDKQAEIFIGDRTDAPDWVETAPSDGTQDLTKKRINLQLMGSSNELFSDYQPHCSNVFSIIDNFYYGTKAKKPQYATKVQASYSVIGWHSKAPKDVVQKRQKRPEETSGKGCIPPFTTREERFRELNLAIKGFQKELEPMTKYPKEIAVWFSESKGEEIDPATRSLCHGAMYDVFWDLNEPPKMVLADHYATLLTAAQPVSVGTTPMDALMAYAGAHEKIDGGVKKEIEAALKRLETLLLSRDDGVEAHAQAADMLYNWNYSRLDGGDEFHAATSGDQTGDKKPRLPKKKQRELVSRNQLCRFRDGAKRNMKQQQWAVFAEWWLSVTEAKTDDKVQATLQPILKSIDRLKEQIELCDKQLGVKKPDPTPPSNFADDEVKEFEPGVHPPYQQQRDPTVLVGGVRSGWEPDYLLKLLVRLDCQLPAEVKQALPDEASSGLGEFCEKVVKTKLPEGLWQSAQSLLREFYWMRTRRDEKKDDGQPEMPSMMVEMSLHRRPDDQLVDELDFSTDGDEPVRPPLTPEIPLFHDRLGLDLDGNKLWRDYWNNTQPWFPLFLEWEIEYTHIEHEDWELSESKWWHGENAKLHYGIKADIDLGKKYDPAPDPDHPPPPKDRRRLSGRVLILPQPSFSLQAKVAQLLANTLPSKLQEILPEDDLKFLDKNLQQLQFLSAPLGGFNSHMATVEQGNHVKPSVRNPADGTLNFLPEAYRTKAGLDGTTMPKMDIETDLTPYGRSRKSIAGSEGPASFKPVSHGQFRVTRLNIIDKFGQAIHAIDPQPVPDGEEGPALWPCISDWYAPGVKKGTDKTMLPNVVDRNIDLADPKEDPRCEFIQVPPQINQPARLNAVWAMPADGKTELEVSSGRVIELGDDDDKLPKKPFWRAANDWDQPIWGWVVVNYANFGLQFFLPSGAFYREVRRGGPTSAMVSPEWLPFSRPDSPDERGGDEDGGVAAKQLARLVKTLSDSPAYLAGFMAMIHAGTVGTGSAAPNAYAEFRSALLGKPLALVNMGWSLELAGPALKTYLNGDGVTPKKLYRDTAKRGAPSPGYEKNDDYDKNYYRFPLKLGGDQGFDGLVGYFKPKTSSALEPGDALDLDKIYSHFYPGTSSYETELTHLLPPQSKTQMAARAEDHIKPISPDTFPRLPPYYIAVTEPVLGRVVMKPDEYADITNEQLCVFGALVDPFAPVHAYSGILPVKELVLPNWTWQASMDRMSAFFHAGPVLLPSDVPDFDVERKLREGQLPPKVIDREEKKEDATGGTKVEKVPGLAFPGGALEQWTWLQPYMQDTLEQFMPLPIEPLDERANLDNGPYTAVEGYLQMASGAVENKKSEPKK